MEFVLAFWPCIRIRIMTTHMGFVAIPTTTPGKSDDDVEQNT